MTRNFGMTGRPASGALTTERPSLGAGAARELNLSPPELRFPDSPLLQALYDILVVLAWIALVSLVASGTVVSLYLLFSLGE